MPFWYEIPIFGLALLAAFLLPGLGLVRLWFPFSDLDLAERLPLGFSLVLGLFAVPFSIATAFGWNWASLEAVWGILALGVIVASVLSRRADSFAGKQSTHWRLGPTFALLAVLSIAALLTIITPRDEDDWTYYGLVRTLADAPQFAPMSLTNLRAGLNVWWFFHAFFVRAMDLDIVRLGRVYFPFVLVPLSLLAFYMLAKTLFADRNRAILACALQLGVYVLELFYANPDVQLTGGWVLGRIDQDHTAAQFIFLPIYVTCMVRYVREGGARWLAASVLSLVVLSAVHPQGFGQAGMLAAAFLVVHLAFEHRRVDLKRAGLLLMPYALLLLALIPFLQYWQQLSSSLSAFDFTNLAVGQSAFPYRFRWVFFLSPTWFTLDPVLLTHPALLAAVLLLPILAWSLHESLAARYLFSTTVLLGVVLYTPLVFEPLSTWLGWSIYRLWYLFPAVLIITYSAPQLLSTFTTVLVGGRRPLLYGQAVRLALCVVGLLLVASRLPEYLRGVPLGMGVDHSTPPGASEALTALRNQAPLRGAVVLAPSNVSDAIPAYSASVIPVLFRYNTTRDRVLDVTDFYVNDLLIQSDLDILARYHVTYLIAPTNHENISQFDFSPAHFVPLYRNLYWVLYRVSQPSKEDDALINANTLFFQGEWQGAADAYNAVLMEHPDNSLAHTGLGMLLKLEGKPQKAAQQLEQAIQIAPTNVQAHYHLSQVYHSLGREQDASAHARAAGALVDGQGQ